MDDLFSSVKWYDALTLSERRAVLAVAASHPAESDEEAEDLGRRWRARLRFPTADLFARRLAAADLNEEEFSSLLATDAAELKRHSPVPSWLRDLEKAFRTPLEAPFELPEWEEGKVPEGAPFVHVAERLLADALRRFESAVSEIDAPPGGTPWQSAAIGRGLIVYLADRLARMMSRTLILELQIARLEDRLQGATSQQRLGSFVDLLHDPKTALEIFHNYPVLARQVTEHAGRWVDTSVELLARLNADWPVIRERWGFDLGTLEAVRTDLGDPHRGGRSVALLTFSSGFHLIYKPRPMTIEHTFQEILEWLGQRGFEPNLRPLEILDRDGYGWCEYIAAAECGSAEEIRRFYERQGAYLALLHLLAASDIHFENLIACGEHPMLIDLETLFQPSTDVLDPRVVPAPAGNSLYRSVLNIGLLPQRIWGNAERAEGVDMSGLGADDEQLTPQRVLTVEGTGTDAMRYVRDFVRFPKKDHTPRLGGETSRADDHVDAIVEGFVRLGRLVLEHRRELLASEAWTSLAQSPIRVLLRPTWRYATLLSETFHPDFLQDALEREILFDHLWTEAAENPLYARLITAERRDLENGDIPLFAGHPDSRDLLTSRGEPLEEIFGESGFDRAERDLRNLDDTGVERQAWLVRMSLQSLRTNRGGLKRTDYPFQEPEGTARRDDLLAAARATAERLDELAFRGPNGDVSWYICVPAATNHWGLETAGANLYSGLPGIALFLAHLGAVLEEPHWTELARAALTTLRHQTRSGLLELDSVGAFTGWGGLIYTFVHIAALWDEDAWLDEAEAIAVRLPEQIAADTTHDIVGGAAGCLVALLMLDEIRPSTATRETAVACGERLLANAKAMETGCGWVLEISGSRPLTGLSHGAAGIAWALLGLAEKTGDPRFRSTALEAIAYERSLFSEATRNWPDLREGERPEGGVMDGDEHFVTAWCHGAPGIGLARLACLPNMDDAAIRAEIDAALATTLAEGFGSNHCLCHGDLGNLDFLMIAGRVLGNRELDARVRTLAAGVLDGIREHGWLYGFPQGLEPLGLMVGLAGIGYGLLRLAEPERVPSVLLLEPPATAF